MNRERNLLEIFPDAAFWYQYTEPTALLELERLRSVALNSGASHNQKGAPARCYHLQGDPLWFDFQPQVFDLIARSNNFGIFHSFIIDRKCERWLKLDGIYGVFGPGVRGLKDLFTIQKDQLSFCGFNFQIKAGQTQPSLFSTFDAGKNTEINPLEPTLSLAAIPWQLL